MYNTLCIIMYKIIILYNYFIICYYVFVWMCECVRVCVFVMAYLDHGVPVVVGGQHVEAGFFLPL